MQESTFVAKRHAAWDRLEQLLVRAGRGGVRALDADELAELGRLYRWVTSDLAYAQGRSYTLGLQHYLNRLTSRAHAYVYGGSLQSGRARFGSFFSTTLPQEFRRSFGYIAICIALTILWSAVAYAVVAHRPSDAYALLPAQIVPGHITKSLHDSNFAVRPQNSPEMATFIIQNNIRVSILAFAAGIVTLGIGTIYEIVFNALMLGALGALFARAGFGFDFWATIAPHGVIELTAIQIAGGAGLLMAAAILYPNRLRRKDALVKNARRAGVLFAGVTVMLLIAGTIEGFFSPLRLPAHVRAGVGAITALALLLYYGFAGRKRRRTTPNRVA
ncbi:MAG: stage II sporulation protein M [Candidatus Eremiobacteraeota bacterium]|nr:stage II sporulation protein M [Candidatus Eremiobacteraeota bacterium]